MEQAPLRSLELEGQAFRHIKPLCPEVKLPGSHLMGPLAPGSKACPGLLGSMVLGLRVGQLHLKDEASIKGPETARDLLQPSNNSSLPNLLHSPQGGLTEPALDEAQQLLTSSTQLLTPVALEVRVEVELELRKAPPEDSPPTGSRGTVRLQVGVFGLWGLQPGGWLQSPASPSSFPLVEDFHCPDPSGISKVELLGEAKGSMQRGGRPGSHCLCMSEDPAVGCQEGLLPAHALDRGPFRQRWHRPEGPDPDLGGVLGQLQAKPQVRLPWHPKAGPEPAQVRHETLGCHRKVQHPALACH
eukprot:11160862-Lingulodinium_polyedra.AAC.1